MYTDRNFKTKKQLKEAVASWLAYNANPEAWHAENGRGIGAGLAPRKPQAVTYFQPGPYGGNEPRDGTVYCEGPHYPEPHRWYAAK